MWPRKITQENTLSLRKDFLGKKRVSNILSHYDGLMVLFVRIEGVQRLGECLGGFGSVVKVESKSRLLRGLFFHDTHLPIQTWFRAMWHICSQKNGMSALGLQRVLGLGSYRSAWLMLHKLRRAMVRPHRERLQGIRSRWNLLGSSGNWRNDWAPDCKQSITRHCSGGFRKRN